MIDINLKITGRTVLAIAVSVGVDPRECDD